MPSMLNASNLVIKKVEAQHFFMASRKIEGRSVNLFVTKKLSFLQH